MDLETKTMLMKSRYENKKGKQIFKLFEIFFFISSDKKLKKQIE